MNDGCIRGTEHGQDWQRERKPQQRAGQGCQQAAAWRLRAPTSFPALEFHEWDVSREYHHPARVTLAPGWGQRGRGEGKIMRKGRLERSRGRPTLE